MRPWRASTAATVACTCAFLADVADVRRADAARRFDLGAHRVELVDLAADDRDRRAERRELVRRAAADARAAAGDEGDLAAKRPGAKIDR